MSNKVNNEYNVKMIILLHNLYTNCIIDDIYPWMNLAYSSQFIQDEIITNNPIKNIKSV